MPFARLILWRIALGFVTLLLVSVVIFLATNALPGDPARAILGAARHARDAGELREQLGLDRPLVARYGVWLGDIVTGDLGQLARRHEAAGEQGHRPPPLQLRAPRRHRGAGQRAAVDGIWRLHGAQARHEARRRRDRRHAHARGAARVRHRHRRHPAALDAGVPPVSAHLAARPVRAALAAARRLRPAGPHADARRAAVHRRA